MHYRKKSECVYYTVQNSELDAYDWVYGTQVATTSWAFSMDDIQYIIDKADYILQIKILEKKMFF